MRAASEALLRDLVAIPSPSGQEDAATNHLVAWLAAQGYDEAHRDAVGNAVGIRGQGKRTLLLLGHIDTFRGQPPLRRVGRRLYGRGAVDAKGPLCAFAAAAAELSIPSTWRVVVVGAVEEEAPSSRGARHIRNQFQPAACLIGEPSGWERITLAYKGRLLLDWLWRGPLGHSAGPQRGGLEHALAYWQRVQKLAADHNAPKKRDHASGHASPPNPPSDSTRILRPRSDGTRVLRPRSDGTRVLRPRSDGTRFQQLDVALQSLHNDDDGLQETVRMTIGLRLPPALEPGTLASNCRALLSDGASLRVYGGESAVEGERNSPLSRALRGAIRAQGGEPRFVRKTGTADWNVVASAWDCPILAYGPGDARLDHRPDEHLDLDEFQRAIAVLRDALTRFFNTAE